MLLNRPLLIFVTLLISVCIFTQTDSRYDSGMNLPFNSREGDVNPQTGGISVTYSDVSLPGRGGMKFSFSRIWTLSQSNMFNMYLDTHDFENRLDGNTLDKYNGLGVGWSSNIPYIYDDISSGDLVKSLFINGEVYEIDQSGVTAGDTVNSNLIGYDLTDKRIFESAEVNYGLMTDYSTLKTEYNLDRTHTENSKYILVMADNTKYFFDDKGNLMMHQDKSGLNRIWYMYRSINDERRLVLVVDSVNRKIRFNYDIYSNLKEIVWDVKQTIINDLGERELITDTRKVQYRYKSIEKTSDYNNLLYNVTNYREQFCLDTVTDPIGNDTKYTYRQGKAGFTFDSTKGHNYNLFLLLSSVSVNYTDTDGIEMYKNKRVLMYEPPADELYRKPFYNGYMEYFKVSNSHYFNRHGKKAKNIDYTYHEEGTSNNYLQYSTKISEGSLTTTYRYSLSSERDKFQTLKSITELTDDNTYRKHTDFVYDMERKKTQEDVWMNGELAYSELFRYNKKGNLEYHSDKNGLITNTLYFDEFSIPKKVTKSFKTDGIDKIYITENEIYDNGLLKSEKIHVASKIITKVTNVYDKWGNLIESTDALGHKTYTIFDSTYHAFPVKEYQDVTISKWDAGSVHDNWLNEPNNTSITKLSIFRVFNSDGSIWVEFDNAGYAIERYYDKLGNEIETINPDADDNNDFLANLTDTIPFNYFRENTTDYNSYIGSRNNNPGTRISIDHQKDLVENEIDFDKSQGGVKRSGVQQDGLGNVEAEIVYNSDGSIYSMKSMSYDSYGRMIALTDQDASESFTNYNAGSWENQKVKLHNKTWIIKYDQVGRKRKVIYPKTRTGRDDIKVITYNDAENSSTTTDPLGRILYERKDWSGNKIEIGCLGNTKTLDSDRQTYLYEYDALNRKVKFTDPMGLVTKYVYDERNLMTEQIYYDTDNPNSTFGSDKMFYNDIGLLEYKTDRKGQVLHFEYDELRRNTSVKHYKSLLDFTDNFARPDREVKSDFDERGNTVRVSSDSLVEHYKYDFANRVENLDRYIIDEDVRKGIEAVTGIAAANQTLSFSYQYNDGGMVTGMTYPDSSIHTFSYDNSLGYLTGISQGSSLGNQTEFIKSLEYNLAGVITKLNYGNNTSQEWAFDNRKRISRITVKGKDGSELEELNYKLNGVGDVESINKEYFYQYDGLGRITGAQTLYPGAIDRMDLVKTHFGFYQHESLYNPSADIFPTENPDGVINGEDHIQATRYDIQDSYDIENFTYDPNGNRKTLEQNEFTFTYKYGDRNRLMSIRRMTTGDPSTDKAYATYKYDANGNTIERVINGDNGTTKTEFRYDAMNRLLSTTVEGRTVSYRYDNAGNRFIKITPDKTTVYLRHGQIAVAMDIDINTNQIAEIGEVNRYVLSGDLTAGRIKSIKYVDLSTTNKYSYYHLDHLNSTKMVTDQSGEIEVNYVYRAFGEQLKKLDKSGAEISNDSARYSYGGKELDADTDLYYFNARYYDPTIGRFINVDPVQDGTNWYVYCNNNPMNMVDPTGLIVWMAVVQAIIKASKVISTIVKATKLSYWLKLGSKFSKIIKGINAIYNGIQTVRGYMDPIGQIKGHIVGKLKSIHYERYKVEKNVYLPQSREEAQEQSQNFEAEKNLFSENASFEYNYGEDEQIAEDSFSMYREDARDANTDPLGHFVMDVLPEWLYGKNSPHEGSTHILERMTGVYENTTTSVRDQETMR